MTESQLSTVKSQNQGLKSLLKKLENKLKESHQECRERNTVITSTFSYDFHNIRLGFQSRKRQDGMEVLLEKKTQRCQQLELVQSQLTEENQTLQHDIAQMELDRTNQLKRIAELTDTARNTKTISSQTDDKIDILTGAIQSAKEIMAAFISVIID